MTKKNDPTAYSEDKIAFRFSDQHAAVAKYCETLGKWFLWDGTRWRLDDTLKIRDLIRIFLRGISGSAPDDAGPRRISSAATASAVAHFAKSDGRHAIRAEELDSRLWELNTPKGTVDLRTGVMEPHDRDALHTKVTLCSPGGDCSHWLAFLHEIFIGDEELVLYMQRVFGHILTGETIEQVFFIAHGPGSNGKSVVWNVLNEILNGYACVAPPATFLATKIERHPTELFALRGARFVIASETEAGGMLAEARLKSLTGSDSITARGMRRDFITFKPQFKLVISSNHLPRLQNVTEAMRRRVQIIPFMKTITSEKREKQIEKRLLKEAPGILRWAIQGCLEWQRLGGLCPPQAVTDASTAYLEGEDLVTVFLKERCERDPGVFVASRILYDAYAMWAADSNLEKLSQPQFRGALANQGWKSEHRRNHNGYAGLRLKFPQEA